MYKIVSISSGIVVATFNKLSFAQDWLADNNNLNGEPANLYKLVIQPRSGVNRKPKP